MKMKPLAKFALQILFLAAAIWAWRENASQKSRAPASANQSPAENSKLKLETGPLHLNKAIGGPVEKNKDVKALVSRPRAEETAQNSEILKFQKLQQKVFLSESEEIEKNEMLSDSDLLAKCASILRDTKSLSAPEFETVQNAAVDLLLEAMKSPSGNRAIELIGEILMDAQVEDSGLSMDLRSTLAGIKAELLYHATALQPGAFEAALARLPGPVSQKIWANVQKRHEENRQESAAELAEQKRANRVAAASETSP